MICRREKLRRVFYKTREEVFRKQLQVSQSKTRFAACRGASLGDFLSAVTLLVGLFCLEHESVTGEGVAKDKVLARHGTPGPSSNSLLFTEPSLHH